MLNGESITGRSDVLLAQVTKMPGPDEALSKNQKGGPHDGEPDDRRRMAHVIARADKKHQGDIAKPTEGDKRSNQSSLPSTVSVLEPL